MKKALIILFLAISILFVRVHSTSFNAFAEEAATAEKEHGGGETEEGIGMTIGRWINFAALLGILYIFLKKTLKVQDSFKANADEISRSIESARLAKEEAERRLQEMDQKMTEMNQEVEKIKTNAMQEAEEEKQRILDSAKKEAERLIEFAHREIDSEVINAKKELRKQVADGAISMGKSIIEREMKDKDHEMLIKEYIEEFGK